MNTVNMFYLSTNSTSLLLRGCIMCRSRTLRHGWYRCVTTTQSWIFNHPVQKKYYSQGAAVSGPGGGGPEQPPRYVCYNLNHHRTLIRIQGADTGVFLQGIITNDMELFEEEEEKEEQQRAVYAHMLNVQGRTLYDIMLYSIKEAEAGPCSFLLECDSAVKDLMLRHLKVYKIRRKVNLSPCPDLSLWAVLPLGKDTSQTVAKPDLSSPERALVWETDARTEAMGWRLVVDNHIDPLSMIASCKHGDAEDYHRHRYAIGLPEGVKDLPVGVALPLESNLEFMRGVSFSKGCYIGQELTARTHHTGVIRKRLMPLRLSPSVQSLEEGGALHTPSGKPAGKHRAGVGELGLGLIRLAHANEVLSVTASDGTRGTAEASVPEWWPKDSKTK